MKNGAKKGIKTHRMSLNFLRRQGRSWGNGQYLGWKCLEVLKETESGIKLIDKIPS